MTEKKYNIIEFGIKKSLFIIILLTIVLIFIEIISYFTLNYLHSKGVIYKPGENISFEKYNSVRDTLLGWPNPNSFGKDSTFDISGSRIIPEYPNPNLNKPIISMYGDSFTFGAEVSNEYSIANQLSKILKKRVSNFGVGGFGTDQAYLRYQRNKNDSANFVILNHFVMDIVRNVNQFRDIVANAGGLGFKPRFILKDDRIELVPIIKLNEKYFAEAINNPEIFFSNDYFLNEMNGGYIKFEFPYSFKVLQSFSHFRVKEQLHNEPYYFEFYNIDHISNALEITKRIIIEFISTAKQRKQIPIIIITPNVYSFEYFYENDKWPYSNLVTLLKQENISVLNLGDEILRLDEKPNFCDYYIDCIGHFNENGNKIVAEIIYKYLQSYYGSTVN